LALTADVAIAGAGLIGSAAALELADAGMEVALLAHARSGAASAAAAGMLAPSMELSSPTVSVIAARARDLYPDFVRQLEERSGTPIELNREGILEIAADEAHAADLAARVRFSGTWLEGGEVTALEPRVVARLGAALWPLDGAVDNTQLLTALVTVLRAHERVHFVDAAAQSLTTAARNATVLARDGTRVDAGRVIVAAGAWSAEIGGAPLARVIEPVRGQLVEFERRVLSHVVYGPRCYLVPRGARTLAGSTMERVGFDPRTTEEAVASLAASARGLCEGLTDAPHASWAGLRPVTPDLLPLIGPDPKKPAVIYACGHSRNGVLLAPLTALLLKQLIFEEPLTFDIGQFRPDRFADTFSVT
jgi:glycine oxidase